MTIETNQRASEPASVSTGFPVTVGWTHAATALYSAMRLNSMVNITMLVEMHGPLHIDLRHHAYTWSTPMELFPVDAVHTGLQTLPTTPDAPPYFELPGKDLDGLLWQIGINSFGRAPAPWLPAGERYRLTRWPNLTKHAHTTPQIQMIAVLGNAYVSISELAAMAGVEESEAQRLINALSLMRILSRSSVAPAAVVAAEPEAPAETEAAADGSAEPVSRSGAHAAPKAPSLFARLRKRLGR